MFGERQSAEPYRIKRRCERCRGQGYVIANICAECGQGFAPDFVLDADGEGTLPCGHGPERLVGREVVCTVCEGRGKVARSVTKEAYRVARRRRKRRGVALFLLALVPVLALGFAIWRAEPAPVCGSWWYGLIPVLLVAGAS